MDHHVRIESVVLRVLRIPLVHPFRTSFGTETVRETIVVSVRGGGLEGFGESPVSAFPGYSPETVETALHVLSDFLLPSLPGFAVEGPPLRLPEQFARVRGHNIAKSGAEGAMWDLLAKSLGEPLSTVLGGSRETIEAGVSIGIQPDVDKLIRRIRAFQDRGYGRIKIKIEKGWDFGVIERVRAEFGSGLRLWADANQDYGPGDVDDLAGLDRFGLELLEQPFAARDLLSHARLAGLMSTPVCLDESVESADDLRTALSMKAIGVLNVKAPRVGGLRSAVAVHDAARDAGVRAWVGGLLETGIGRLHNVALATLGNFNLPGDISESARYFERDVVTPPVVLADGGVIRVPAGPGIGAEVDMGLIESYAVRTAEFR